VEGKNVYKIPLAVFCSEIFKLFYWIYSNHLPNHNLLLTLTGLTLRLFHFMSICAIYLNYFLCFIVRVFSNKNKQLVIIMICFMRNPLL